MHLRRVPFNPWRSREVPRNIQGHRETVLKRFCWQSFKSLQLRSIHLAACRCRMMQTNYMSVIEWRRCPHTSMCVCAEFILVMWRQKYLCKLLVQGAVMVPNGTHKNPHLHDTPYSHWVSTHPPMTVWASTWRRWHRYTYPVPTCLSVGAWVDEYWYVCSLHPKWLKKKMQLQPQAMDSFFEENILAGDCDLRRRPSRHLSYSKLFIFKECWSMLITMNCASLCFTHLRQRLAVRSWNRQSNGYCNCRTVRVPTCHLSQSDFGGQGLCRICLVLQATVRLSRLSRLSDCEPQRASSELHCWRQKQGPLQ